MSKKDKVHLHHSEDATIYTRWIPRENINCLRGYLCMAATSSTYISKEEVVRAGRYNHIVKAQGEPVKIKVTISIERLEE